MQRSLLTLAILVAAGLVAIAMFRSHQQTAERATTTQSEQETDTPAPRDPPEEAASPGGAPPRPGAPEPPREPEAPLASLGPLSIQPLGEPGPTVLGATGEDSTDRMRVELTKWGAGIFKIELADYFQTPRKQKPYVVHGMVTGGRATAYPFAARTITVNGDRLKLADQAWSLRESGPRHAEYAIEIRDEAGAPVLEVHRRYELAENRHELACRSWLVNRAGQPLDVQWEQHAQGDVPPDKATYLGDTRRFLAGYLDLPYDPRGQFIDTAATSVGRQEALDGVNADAKFDWPHAWWPEGTEGVWMASLNRYFTAVTYPRVPPETSQPPRLSNTFETGWLTGIGEGEEAGLLAVLRTPTHRLEAGETIRVDLALFAGPRLRERFDAAPFDLLHLSRLVVYELGCTWCTFQPIARGLLALLKFFHVVVGDWAIAIMLLVILVRLLLHPITKKSQIAMMKMGKQMQALQPEMEKLKKKYEDDPQRFQQEQLKLFREKGVNPAGMVGGCAPMLLQMPIWIALYAMLFYAIELRHEAAFYGLFQWISGGAWGFLADLSAPDHLITFSQTPVRINFPLLNLLDFSSLNVLPLLWAFTMFFYQKFMSPPPATEQAAQQQKMMQFMMLGIFPLFLYSAPSGLLLYMLASSASGIFDSHLVRKHVNEQEAAGTLFDKKPRKEGGLTDRLAKLVEEKQREMAEQQKQQQKQGQKPKKKRK